MGVLTSDSSAQGGVLRDVSRWSAQSTPGEAVCPIMPVLAGVVQSISFVSRRPRDLVVGSGMNSDQPRPAKVSLFSHVERPVVWLAWVTSLASARLILGKDDRSVCLLDDSPWTDENQAGLP